MNSGSKDLADNNKIKIIIDEPTFEGAIQGALDFQDYSKNLSNIIRETTPPQFAVGIFGKWGSGKTTLMKMIKQKLDEDNNRDKILTVWFDAWRYEREKYLAIIPFLRLIRIALDKDSDKKKNPKWRKVKKALQKTSTAFIESTDVSFAALGYPASITTSPKRFWYSLKSKGSATIDGENVQFHEHVTDYLGNALKNLEKENPDSRIVVFVDDLDRCTPQNALEVIESIKSFFAIKGIVYVIGMDSESINNIIKEKYGENSNIDGLKSLEKIVQLPFQIPVWTGKDIEESIEKIISKELEGSKLSRGI